MSVSHHLRFRAEPTIPASGGSPTTPPGRHRRQRPARPQPPHRKPPRRRLRRWLAVLVVVALVPVGVSYARAVTYPGRASLFERTVEWIRDHGGAPVVNLAENIYYTVFTAPSGDLPGVGSVPATAPGPPGANIPAPLAVAPGIPPVPGEGLWRAAPAIHGAPSGVATTFVRPDPRHGSVVAGVARFDQNLVATRLIPGTREPSGLGWPEGGQVPAALVPSLAATFNSGWKMQDAHGGVLVDGRIPVALRDGAASMVIDRAGRATIGRWGHDVGPGPDVLAVRQNLDLVVEQGRPVDGLDSNANGRWGSSRNQLQYTWRSGVGIDGAGNLIFVAGNRLNLVALADALKQAGVRTGMQLDIHSGKVDMFTYDHRSGNRTLQGTPLLPDMPVPADRYLTADQRDFFAVTVRRAAGEDPVTRGFASR